MRECFPLRKHYVFILCRVYVTKCVPCTKNIHYPRTRLWMKFFVSRRLYMHMTSCNAFAKQPEYYDATVLQIVSDNGMSSFYSRNKSLWASWWFHSATSNLQRGWLLSWSRLEICRPLVSKEQVSHVCSRFSIGNDNATFVEFDWLRKKSKRAARAARTSEQFCNFDDCSSKQK